MNDHYLAFDSKYESLFYLQRKCLLSGDKHSHFSIPEFTHRTTQFQLLPDTLSIKPSAPTSEYSASVFPTEKYWM